MGGTDLLLNCGSAGAADSVKSVKSVFSKVNQQQNRLWMEAGEPPPQLQQQQQQQQRRWQRGVII